MQVREQIETMSGVFTASERKLVATLLADYPFAGLDTIQTLAQRSNVSAPSVTRFIHKIGCQNYQDFQRRLIGELKESQHSPVILHSRQKPVETEFLGDFIERNAAVAVRAAEAVTEAQFKRACALLSDTKRAVFVLGGRFSDPVAQLLSRHLRQIRPNVFHLPPDQEVWPEYLLRMRARDVFVLVDVRRYQGNLQPLAEAAVRDRGSRLLLMTDRWQSPTAQLAAEILTVPIENDTAWDTYVAFVSLIEALVAQVAEQNWAATRDRIKAWDALRTDY